MLGKFEGVFFFGEHSLEAALSPCEKRDFKGLGCGSFFA
jgi:hypothetical protein